MKVHLSTGFFAIIALAACADESSRCVLDPQGLEITVSSLGLDRSIGEVDPSSRFQMNAAGRTCGVLWGVDNQGAFVCAGDGALVTASDVVPSVGSRPVIAFDGDLVHVAFVHAFNEILYAARASDTLVAASEPSEAPAPIDGCDTPGGSMVVLDGEPRLVCDRGEATSVTTRDATGAWSSLTMEPTDISAMSAVSALNDGTMYSAFGVYDLAEPERWRLELIAVPASGASSAPQVILESSGIGLFELAFNARGRFAVLAVSDVRQGGNVAENDLVLVVGEPGDASSVTTTVATRLLGGIIDASMTEDAAGHFHIVWFEHDHSVDPPIRQLGYAFIARPGDEPVSVRYTLGDPSSPADALGTEGALELLRVDVEHGHAVARGLLMGGSSDTTPLATIRLPRCR